MIINRKKLTNEKNNYESKKMEPTLSSYLELSISEHLKDILNKIGQNELQRLVTWC